MNNRLWNCRNPHQGDAKKVLCVCSAGLLRSPTAAQVLNQKYGFNTRAAGLDQGHALIPIDDVLLTWADEIVCMTKDQERVLKYSLETLGHTTQVKCLDIEDSFAYMDSKLIELINSNYVE